MRTNIYEFETKMPTIHVSPLENMKLLPNRDPTAQEFDTFQILTIDLYNINN